MRKASSSIFPSSHLCISCFSIFHIISISSALPFRIFATIYCQHTKKTCKLNGFPSCPLSQSVFSNISIYNEDKDRLVKTKKLWSVGSWYIHNWSVWHFTRQMVTHKVHMSDLNSGIFIFIPVVSLLLFLSKSPECLAAPAEQLSSQRNGSLWL